jgi:hypothetical protein
LPGRPSARGGLVGQGLHAAPIARAGRRRPGFRRRSG